MPLAKNNPSMALGGWSAGGILAVEAIRQINAQGLAQISHLVLLDSPNSIGLQNPPKRMYDPKTSEWLLQHFDTFIRVLDAYEPTLLDKAPVSLIINARDGMCKDPNGWTSIPRRQQLKVEVLDEVNHFTLKGRGPVMEKMGNILAKCFKYK
ncbi:hypothetical protein BJX96DRAFT_171333 [Aspergillus floccosus]